MNLPRNRVGGSPIRRKIPCSAVGVPRPGYRYCNSRRPSARRSFGPASSKRVQAAAGLDRATPGTRVRLTGVPGRQSRPSRRLPSHSDRQLRHVASLTPISAPNRLWLDRPLDHLSAKPRRLGRINAVDGREPSQQGKCRPWRRESPSATQYFQGLRRRLSNLPTN